MALLITLDPMVIYILICLSSAYIFIKTKLEFKKEALLDFFINLTTKINSLLLVICFLLISVFTILDINQTNIDIALQDIFKMIIIFSFFNYGVYYLIKLLRFIYDFFKKNELVDFSLMDKVEVKNK